MKCSNCGTEFEEGIFCPECGTKYEEVLQGSGREVKEVKKENEDSQKKFFLKRNPKRESQKRKSKKILVGISIVFIILIITLSGGSNNNDVDEEKVQDMELVDEDTENNISESIQKLSAKETVEAFLKAITTADYDTAIQFCAKEWNHYDTLNSLRSSELYEYFALDLADGDEEYAKKIAANKHFKEHIASMLEYMYNGRYSIIDEVLAEDDIVEYKVVLEKADNMDELNQSYLSVFFEKCYYDNPNKVDELISGDLSTLWIDFFEMYGKELNAEFENFLDTNLAYSEHEANIVLKKVNDQWVIISAVGVDDEGKIVEPDVLELVDNNMDEFDTSVQEYIFQDSDSRYLSEEEVRSIEIDKLRIARNEIFARHGYIFNDEGLNKYFNNTSWYEGTIPSDQFDMDTVLNDFEKKNTELIEKVEDELNGEGNRQETFIGKTGTYLTTYYVDGFTPRIDILEIEEDTLTFTLGVLGHPTNMLEETAQIIDSNTAQLDYYGFIITLTWTDTGNIHVTHQGELTGMDSGIIMPATDGQEYIWAEEFN